MGRAKEKKNNSLQRVVYTTILFSACVILTLAICIEAAAIVIPTLKSYKNEARHIDSFVTALMDRKYLIDYAGKVKEVYYGAPEEIRRDQFSDEYKQMIVPIIDDEYREKRNMLSECRVDAELQDIYYVFWDPEYERMVILFDGNDKKMAYLPGQWISNENGMIETPEKIDKTMKSNWYMPMSYGKDYGLVGSYYNGVYDDDGNLVCYIAITITADSLTERIRKFFAVVIPVLLLLSLIVTTNSAKWSKRRFVEPIESLTNKAREYSALNGYSDESSKMVFEELSINTGDEIEVLWKTMVEMEKDINAAMKRIATETAEKERNAIELATAKNIQCGIVPLELGLEGDGFEAFGCGHPAKMVGGDFYDIFQVDSDNVCVIVGDISGKGISAALFMIMVKSAIREKLRMGASLSEALINANADINKANPENMFATVFAAALNTKTGILKCANAGHNPPVILKDSPEFLKLNSGVILGVLEQMNLGEAQLQLSPGEGILIYTDGVTEAFNKNDEEYGNDRLLETIRRCYSDGNNNYNSKKLVSAVVDSVNEYSEGLDQFDDLTCATLIYR